MSTSHTCTSCGSTLHPDLAGEICPACLLLGAVDEKPGLGSIGGLELEEIIARGGMGIVYRARQASTDRVVALKALPGASLLSNEACQRFKLEAQAMARLDHPAILPVYEFGEDGTTPFFTMKLATGGTLAHRIGDYHGQWREIAALMARIADAVQFAHERGVLHRDLKPGNILFDEAGNPFVSDFGLAKMLDDESDLTRTLSLIGTPNYMAPEILTHGTGASTVACDVWSLGVILWELLSSSPPFQRSNITATIRAVTSDKPAPLPPQVPSDLAAIAAKTLQPEPSRRYASARQFADDLESWLNGRPVQARPVTILERAWLWARRNRTKAAMILVACASVIVASMVSWDSRNEVHEALRVSMINEAQLKSRSGKAGQRHDSLEILKRAAAIHQDGRLITECAAALARLDIRFSPAWTMKHLMMEQRPEISPDKALCAATRPEGGFVLYSTSNGEVVKECKADAPAVSFAFASDGKSLMVRLANDRVQLWKTSGKEPVSEAPVRNERTMELATQASFSPALNAWVITREDGSLVQITPEGIVSAFDLPTSMKPGNLSFDPAGKRLALVTNNLIEVWNVAGEHRRIWSAPMMTLRDVLSWNHDGTLLAFGTSRNVREISIVEPLTGFIRSTLRGAIQLPERVAFHPSEPLLAATARDSIVRIWDYRDGRELVHAAAAHSSLAWSSDGKRLWCCVGESDFGSYELTQSTVLREFDSPPVFGQGNASEFLASGDNRLLMSANGKRLRFWHPALRQFLGEIASDDVSMERAFLAHDSSFCAYAVKADNSHIARHALTFSADGTRLSIGPREDVPGSEDSILLALPSDGSWITWHTKTQAISLWPAGDASQQRLLIKSCSANTKFSPDMRWAVSAQTDQDDVQVCDLQTTQPPLIVHLEGATSIRWSPDGSWVFLHGAEENVLLEAGTWHELARWQADDDVHGRKCIAISGDSRWLSYSLSNDTIQLVQLPSTRKVLQLHAPDDLDFRRAIFSKDGRRLWTMGVAGRVFEWDFDALTTELQMLGITWTTSSR